MSDFMKLCGLWKGESRSGKPTVSGNLGMMKIWLFPNRQKQGDNSPDYWLLLTPKKAADHAANGRSDEPPPDEDIPF